MWSSQRLQRRPSNMPKPQSRPTDVAAAVLLRRRCHPQVRVKPLVSCCSSCVSSTLLFSFFLFFLLFLPYSLKTSLHFTSLHFTSPHFTSSFEPRRIFCCFEYQLIYCNCRRPFALCALLKHKVLKQSINTSNNLLYIV